MNASRLAELLKPWFKDFPRATNDELHQASKPESFSDLISTDEERQALQQLFKAAGLFEEVAFFPVNLYRVFCECDDIDQSLRVEVFFSQLKNSLIHEHHPLPVLFYLAMDTPVHFVASLLYLLYRNVATEMILQSEMLHQFFQQHYPIKPEWISASYALLEQIGPRLVQKQKVDVLITKVRQTAAEPTQSRKIYPCLRLNGEVDSTSANFIRTYPPNFSVALDSSNLKSVYGLFGFGFLLLSLKWCSTVRHPVLVEFLTSQLQHCSAEAIDFIYKWVSTNEADINRIPLLTTLDGLLLEQQIAAQLNCPKKIWLILSANRDRMTLLSESSLQLLATTPLPSESLLPIVAQLFHRTSPLETHKEQLFYNVFQLLYAQPKLYLISNYQSICQQLTLYPKTMDWCADASAQIVQALTKILQPQEPLTPERFQLVLECYQQFSKQIHLFHALSTKPLTSLPHDKLGLQSFILRSLFQANPKTDIQAALNCFLTPEERVNPEASVRMLYESLCRENDKDWLHAVTTVLKTVFEEQEWWHANLDGKPILYHALYYGNEALLAHFFPETMSNEEQYQVLQTLSQCLRQTQGHSLIMMALRHPVMLRTVLSVYPKKYMSTLFNESEMGRTTLHMALRQPACVHLLLENLPDISYLDKRNFEGNSVLESALSYLESLLILCAFISSKDRYLRFTHKTTQISLSLLEKALYDNELLESFDILLWSLSEDEQKKARRTIYASLELANRVIGHNVPRLKKALSLCPTLESQLEAILFKDILGNTLLHMTYDKPDVFQALLVLFPTTERLLAALMQRNNAHKTPVELSLAYPNSFYTMLGCLPISKWLSLLSQENEKGEIILHSESAAKYLWFIFYPLSQDDRLAGVFLRNKQGQTFLVKQFHQDMWKETPVLTLEFFLLLQHAPNTIYSLTEELSTRRSAFNEYWLSLIQKQPLAKKVKAPYGSKEKMAYKMEKLLVTIGAAKTALLDTPTHYKDIQTFIEICRELIEKHALNLTDTWKLLLDELMTAIKSLEPSAQTQLHGFFNQHTCPEESGQAACPAYSSSVLLQSQSFTKP